MHVFCLLRVTGLYSAARVRQDQAGTARTGVTDVKNSGKLTKDLLNTFRRIYYFRMREVYYEIQRTNRNCRDHNLIITNT